MRDIGSCEHLLQSGKKKKKNRQQIDYKQQQPNMLLKVVDYVANLTTVQSQSGRFDYSPENQIKKKKSIVSYQNERMYKYL